jgi:hypothetical protein
MKELYGSSKLLEAGFNVQWRPPLGVYMED